MTLEEMRDVLATMAAYDGRAVDRRVIEDWHAIAGSLRFDLAIAAVRNWYTFNSGYMQPHDLAASAAVLAGIARPDSITQRRIEGRALPPSVSGELPLAAPLNLERKASQ